MNQDPLRVDLERLRRVLAAQPALLNRLTQSLAEIVAHVVQDRQNPAGPVPGPSSQPGPQPSPQPGPQPSPQPGPQPSPQPGPAPGPRPAPGPGLQPPRVSQAPPGASPPPPLPPPFRPPRGPFPAPPPRKNGEPISRPPRGDDDGPPFGEKIPIAGPLIFIPGILGSQLWQGSGNGGDIRVWPPLGAFGTESLKLLQSNAPTEPDQLFPGAYEELIHFITRKMGYIVNKNFFIFPYDWRLTNRTTGQKLRDRILEVLADFPPGTRCDLIGHSMGGLVIRSALVIHKLIEADPPVVGRVTYLASPFFGSPQAYFALHDGISLQFKFGGFFKKLVAEVTWDALIKKNGDPDDVEEGLKGLAQSFDSVYELLPDDFYLADGRAILEIESAGSAFFGRTKVPTTAETYTVDEKVGWALGAFQDSAVKRALKFKGNLTSAVPGSLNDNLVVYSSELQTVDFVVFKDFLGSMGDGFRNPQPSAGRGDATVPTFSGRAGLLDGPQVVEVGGTHNQVANDESTFMLIHRFLARPR